MKVWVSISIINSVISQTKPEKNMPQEKHGLIRLAPIRHSFRERVTDVPDVRGDTTSRRVWNQSPFYLSHPEPFPTSRLQAVSLALSSATRCHPLAFCLLPLLEPEFNQWNLWDFQGFSMIALTISRSKGWWYTYCQIDKIFSEPELIIDAYFVMLGRNKIPGVTKLSKIL